MNKCLFRNAPEIKELNGYTYVSGGHHKAPEATLARVYLHNVVDIKRKTRTVRASTSFKVTELVITYTDGTSTIIDCFLADQE